MKPIQKICVFGVGGVGGVIGAKIAQTFAAQENTGREIYFVARGEHLREIQTGGLVMEGTETIKCRPTRAVSDFKELPLADLIFVTVKGYDLENVIRQISSHIKDDAIVIPLLNGVDIYQRIRKHLITGIVLPACVYVSAFVEKPGIVRLMGDSSMIVLGKDPEHPGVDQHHVLELLHEAKIPYRWVEKPFAAIWEKYALIASCALVTAAYGKTFGEVVAELGLRRQLEAVIAEIRLIAAAEGVNLPENIGDSILNRIAGLPLDAKTSYQRDVEEKGRQNEGDLFGGTMSRLSRKHRIPIPVTSELFRMIEEKLRTMN